MEVTIALGLPGSGKTSLLERKLEESRIDVDELIYIDEVYNNEISNAIHLIKEELEYIDGTPKYGFIDMLFINLDNLRELKEVLDMHFKEYNMNIYLFDNDLENALINDFIRKRHKTAEQTIRYMSEHWEFTEDSIRRVFPNATVREVSTHKPSQLDVMIWKHKIRNQYITSETIRSESWHVSSAYVIDDNVVYDDSECAKEDFGVLYEFLEELGATEYYDELFKKSRIVSSSIDDIYDIWRFKYYEIDTKTVLEVIGG